MWNLAHSRSRFYVDCMRPEENFWKTLFTEADKLHLVSDAKYAEFLSWKPRQSNCPELEQVAKRLTDLAPIEWRATMKNIFVARAFKGDANAEASSFRSAGIIELNYGLTTAAMIYSSLFCQFYDSIWTTAKEVDFTDENLDDITQMILDEISRSAVEPILVAEQSTQTWAKERNVYVIHPLLAELPSRRKDEDYHKLVTATEMFVVAHEFCHHLIGHTADYFRHAPKVKTMVGEWLTRIDAEDTLSGLNKSQIAELESDVGAFLLLSGAFSNNISLPRIYSAVCGSMLALVSLAHVNDTWTSTAEGSHPDFLVRYDLIARMIREVSMEIPLSKDGHPVGFLIQFRGFISAVLQAWISNGKGEIQMPNFLDIFSWMIDLEAEFKEEHQLYNQD
ncbi:hypothetical protein PV394_22365 [Streptomyces sp. NE06-03E]|uniref:hypothetical protein n=1 Tax=Streptomyces sp. NE06-03E TaxID=3028695 RepID=UPI0029AA9B21|nr:hypothetical protein [Streptomyces sp. NE06-03E]MDX3057849.1 hypothetical protein [Streptomyces sp. NE06-03E]